MSAYKQRSIATLVIGVYVLTLLACTLPGQAGPQAAGAKPTVTVIEPAPGARAAPGETVTVRFMAVDASGVARVDLLIDNALADSQVMPQPASAYQGTFTWIAAAPGPHVLLVRATNAAGAVSDPAVVSVLVTGVEPVPTSAQALATVMPEATIAPPTVTIPLATVQPTVQATTQPTVQPTVQATTQPTAQATAQPTVQPTAKATVRPTTMPSAPALTGQIAFPVLNADDPEKYDIWVVNADGTNARLVVKKMRQPCFRPDGAMLACNGEAPDQHHIIIMNADGSEQRPASQHVEDSHPSWSTEGKRLVYDTTAAPGGGWQICIVDNVEARDSWHALPDPGGDVGKGLQGRYPTWMSDGRIIFKTSNYWGDNNQAGLYITSGGAGIPSRVTSHYEDTAPAVYGGTVAFMSMRTPGDYEIFTASVYGLDAGLKQLTDNNAQDGLPAWSPDGQFIAFVSDEGGRWGLWAMRADGTGRQKIIDLPSPLGGDWGSERVSWAP